MPEEIVRFYDWMDSLENFDYGTYSLRDIELNQDMYYKLVEEEFPEQFAEMFL